MNHTVTITHEVEAESWDLAVEKVLRSPNERISYVTVKSPGTRLTHVNMATLCRALKQIRHEQK